VVLVVVAVLMAGFQALPVQAQFFFMENENIGKEVQDFTLKMLNGKETNFKEYRAGKNTLVFFWATWCPHCRETLDMLNEQKADIEAQEIKVVLVDVGETEPIVNKYMEKHKVDIEVFMDEDSAVSESYGLIGVPTFYFIDQKGIVTDVQHSLPKDFTKVFPKT